MQYRKALGILAFIALQVTEPARSAQTDRLDPHGLANQNYRAAGQFSASSSCTICHNQRHGSIHLKPDVADSCQNCHNQYFHSGLPEHLGKVNFHGPKSKKISCLSCHFPHRYDGGKLGSIGNSTAMIRKDCVECHGKIETSKYPHAQHLKITNKLNISCTNCHHFDIQSPGPDPLGPTTSRPLIQVDQKICQDCHGLAPSKSFADNCITCHRRQNEKSIQHSLSASKPHLSKDVSCLSCHLPHTQKHKSFEFKDEGLCVNCHTDRKYQHRAVDLISKDAISCRTCHRLHNSQKKDLVVITTKLKKLCASCHGQKSTELIRSFHLQK